MITAQLVLPQLIKDHENVILKDWMKEQLAAVTRRADLISETELAQQSRDFLRGFQEATQAGDLADITGPTWQGVRGILEHLSQNWAKLGFSASETATFVFSLKQPLFTLIHSELRGDSKALADETWTATVLLDKLGLFTTESVIKRREEMIKRQQADLLELSTPVVKLWDHIVAVPLIGTLDSGRTQIVMESLLQELVNTSSSVAIIDITGVPTVDTLVAQHLLKTVSAARLMGAECVISGVRPQIAQAMVQLGVSFQEIVTRATLADALRYAFAKTGFSVLRAEKQA